MKEFINKHPILTCSIFAFILSFACSAYGYVKLMENTVSSNPIFETKEDKKIEDKTYNILLLGVDERQDDVGRSDTMIVASVNFATRKIGLISVPRDTLVNIPSRGEQKLNHAFAYGGEQSTKFLIEKLLDIKIDNYIVVNFKAFKNIIASIGGIDVDVEKDMYYRDDYDGPDGFIIDLKKGQQHLDENGAIQYVRFRDEEGDIGRVKRQQKFINAVLEQLVKPENVANYPNIARSIIGSIKTDLNFSDIAKFASMISPSEKFDIRAITLDGEPQEIDELSYWVLNKDKVMSQLFALNDFMIGNEKIVMASQDNTKNIAIDKKDANIVETNKEIAFNSNPAGIMKSDMLEWEIKKIEASLKDKNIRDELVHDKTEINTEEKKYRRERSSISGIRIINTTKDDSKLQKAINIMDEADIDVQSTTTTTSEKPNKKTILVVNTNDKDLVSAIRDFEFKYTLIYRNHNEPSTLIIGADF